MEQIISFFVTHRGTIIVLAILILVLTLIVWGMIRDRKKGKSGCGCGCAHCAMNESCHPKPDQDK